MDEMAKTTYKMLLNSPGILVILVLFNSCCKDVWDWAVATLVPFNGSQPGGP